MCIIICNFALVRTNICAFTCASCSQYAIIGFPRHRSLLVSRTSEDSAACWWKMQKGCGIIRSHLQTSWRSSIYNSPNRYNEYWNWLTLLTLPAATIRMIHKIHKELWHTLIRHYIHQQLHPHPSYQQLCLRCSSPPIMVSWANVRRNKAICNIQ